MTLVVADTVGTDTHDERKASESSNVIFRIFKINTPTKIGFYIILASLRRDICTTKSILQGFD